jgi:ATP-dependent exoDNAse (exonuclease V) beta subunit
LPTLRDEAVAIAKLLSAARLFYVAATRATQRLMFPLSGSEKSAARLSEQLA